jgi:glycolate oxidase iron-sulfur subunit
VHCGFCLPACPTYDVLGTEMDSPRGRLHTMLALDAGRIAPTEAVVRHLDLCLMCRACETACPSGVPFSHLLEDTRESLVGSSVRPRSQRVMERLITWAVALPPGVQRAGSLALRAAERLGLGKRLADSSRGTGPRAMAAGLLLSSPPDPTRLPTITPAVGQRRMRVGMLTGCVARWTFGRVNEATALLLSRAGCEVVVAPAQRCCGALHLHGGRKAGARKLARRNIAAFDEVGHLDAVIVNAAGCGTALKDYGRLLADDPLWADRAARFAASTRDALELLDELGLPPPKRPVPRRVAYHDACHLAHGQGIRSGPRRLLESIPGLTLVPLADADRCCGSAGIYNILHPAEAQAILDPKLDRLAASGAEVVAAANPGCLMHLAAGARRAGLALETRHPLELLAEAYR